MIRQRRPIGITALATLLALLAATAVANAIDAFAVDASWRHPRLAGSVAMLYATLALATAVGLVRLSRWARELTPRGPWSPW
ncbi:MAG TPA: hypothetical protein VJV22_16445 [Acidobacteriaceae bacterium]|nr:hypothetical protein [Acidobacteriaceae bacterium]